MKHLAGGSVLVLKPSSLGDIVHTLPAVARIKEARPDWRIAWLVNTEWAPLLEGNPDVDEVIAFPRREFRGPASWPRLAGWVRANLVGRRPELAIDFQGLMRTALLARLSGARRLAGSADAREGASWLYHQTAPLPEGVPHAVERYLALADAVLGERNAGPLRYPLPTGYMPAGAEGLRDYVLVHPFSRGRGKSLSAGQVKEICRGVAPRPVVLVGRYDGEPLPPLSNVMDLLNRTTIGELIWLLRRATFVISVDSGPMHLGAALDRPLVGIHTWTDPRKVGPYRPDAWVWKGGRLFQMKDAGAVTPSLAALPAEALGSADLAAICRLAGGGNQ